MKPVGSSRGRGIFLISELKDVSYSESMVVQRYIHNPLLIGAHFLHFIRKFPLSYEVLHDKMHEIDRRLQVRPPAVRLRAVVPALRSVFPSFSATFDRKMQRLPLFP
jgi:hypothetical protein